MEKVQLYANDEYNIENETKEYKKKILDFCEKTKVPRSREDQFY